MHSLCQVHLFVLDCVNQIVSEGQQIAKWNDRMAVENCCVVLVLGDGLVFLSYCVLV